MHGKDRIKHGALKVCRRLTGGASALERIGEWVSGFSVDIGHKGGGDFVGRKIAKSQKCNLAKSVTS